MKLARINLAFLSLALLVLLEGCAGGTVVKTYDGDTQPSQDIAVLTASENIELISVNGKPVKQYLMQNLEVKYGLLPGENLVVFQYGSVWGTPTLGDEDAPRAKELVSSPREVLINAKAGDLLTFRHEKADNIREAEVLASQFEAEIIDQNNQVIAISGAPGRYQKASEPEPMPVVSAVAESVAMTVQAPDVATGSKLPTIDAMKVLWGSASSEEKKAFLKWAFQ